MMNNHSGCARTIFQLSKKIFEYYLFFYRKSHINPYINFLFCSFQISVVSYPFIQLYYFYFVQYGPFKTSISVGIPSMRIYLSELLAVSTAICPNTSIVSNLNILVFISRMSEYSERGLKIYTLLII